MEPNIEIKAEANLTEPIKQVTEKLLFHQQKKYLRELLNY